MLKTRVASAAVAIFMLIAIVCLGKTILGLAVFVISIIAMHEYFKAIEKAQYRPAKFAGYLSCLYILVLCFTSFTTNFLDFFKHIYSLRILAMGIFSVMIILMFYIIFLNKEYNIVDISLTFFAVFYIVFLLSFIVLTANMKNGFFFIWFIFIGAFATDTFAYFSGRIFGKRKLLPSISPKKTVEGAIGGVVGCVLITLLYGIYLNMREYIGFIPPNHFIILGAICGVISQMGDWGASSIKRYTKIKDFGNIMPGHGGVLDRLDSILFTAPIVYFYFSFII